MSGACIEPIRCAANLKISHISRIKGKKDACSGNLFFRCRLALKWRYSATFCAYLCVIVLISASYCLRLIVYAVHIADMPWAREKVPQQLRKSAFSFGNDCMGTHRPNRRYRKRGNVILRRNHAKKSTVWCGNQFFFDFDTKFLFLINHQ